ncbi:MAG TPA: ATP-binding protein [Candidatus Saccharimonadia bacterium]|nr:ATP-binding protein [Candidatus Saccharimonadia bacterium]
MLEVYVESAPTTDAQLQNELATLRHRLAEIENAEAIAIEELQSTVEQLQAVEEELRQQHDELVETRRQVATERARYTALFDLAPDGYLVTNAAGVIQEANRAAVALLAVSQEVLVGKPLLLWIAKEDRLAFHTQLSRLTQEQQVHDWELWLQRQQGSAFPASITVGVRQHPQEQQPVLYWLLRDLTERKRVEETLRRTESLALLGKLAAGVSHEIRNPLGAIVLHMDLLEEELQDLLSEWPAQIAEPLADVRTQLTRLGDLVQDYLSLARLASLQREPADIGTFVDDVLKEVAPQVAKCEVTLRREGPASLGQVALHANTLRRVLLNLVQNALDAMLQGGTLTLRGWQTASHVHLDICDTGAGIPADQLAQIFEPLYTTKPAGTGLGLYMAREIVAAHDGEIRVTSQVGSGTTFTITLPLVDDAPVAR